MSVTAATMNRPLTRRMSSRLLACAILLVFWANGLAYLASWPPVHEDEPWILSPGYTFWGEGRFGSDLFSGFYGMEDHFFGFLPLFSLLNGGLARLIGLGLFQLRYGTLALMLLALAATYKVGQRLFSARVGLLALLILTFFRLAGPFPHLKTGIPFADAARIARYDMAVPIFGLLALLTIINEVAASTKLLTGPKTSVQPEKRAASDLKPRFKSFLVAGMLIGLAGLCHIYGLLWLPGLALSLGWLWGKRAVGPVLWMVLGLVVVWLPYLLYVALAWDDFLGQNYVNAARSDIANPIFYLLNLLQEVERYDPLLNGAKEHLGAWLFLIGLPLATLLLLYRAIWQKSASAVIIVGPMLVLMAGLGLLLATKTFTYLATLWPLFAITLAAGMAVAWQAKPAPRWWRPVLASLLILALLEGSWGLGEFRRQAAQATPYAAFTARLAAHIPPGSRIVALQHYWPGLSEFEYRTLLVPFFQASARNTPRPISFYDGLAQTAPDVIMIDEPVQQYFDGISGPTHPNRHIWLDFERYLADHQGQVLARFEDPTYGRMTIYEIGSKE